MEYMRLEGFLGRAVSRFINKALESKVGFKPNLELQGLKLETDDTDNYVRVTGTMFLPKDEFEKMIEEVTK